MTYVKEHAGAVRDVQKAGLPVTFTRTVQNVDPTTELTSAPTVSTVDGYAIRVRGNPRAYEALKLTEKEPLSLMFAPKTYGQLPLLDSLVTWAGKSFVVRFVEPVAPDGNAILAKVILST